MGKSNPDEHTVKPAGKPSFIAKALSGQPRMHGTEAEFTLGRLGFGSQRYGERASMDRNRRP